jgi:hypothetical protein
VPALDSKPVAGSVPGSSMPPGHAQNPEPVPTIGALNGPVPSPVPVPIEPWSRMQPASHVSGHMSVPVPVSDMLLVWVAMPVVVPLPVLVLPLFGCGAVCVAVPIELVSASVLLTIEPPQAEAVAPSDKRSIPVILFTRPVYAARRERQTRRNECLPPRGVRWVEALG